MTVWLEDDYCEDSILSLINTIKNGGSLCAYAYDEDQLIIWDNDKPISAGVYFEEQKKTQLEGYTTFISKPIKFKETQNECGTSLGVFIKNHIEGTNIPFSKQACLPQYIEIFVGSGEIVIHAKNDTNNFVSAKVKRRKWFNWFK